jgi:chemotaxis protein MotA
MYKLFKQAKQNLLSIEAHIENPEGSDIFKEFPSVLKNHHAIHFICDTLKVQVASPMGPFELEELMDKDLKVAHAEEHLAPSTITRIGDAFPGLGIVAAVLGVVITMGKLSQGKEVIGHSVGAALVGTFIGILLSYGFFQPLAAKMELNLGEEGKYLEVLKVGILAFAKDSSPKVCVEFARRAIPPQVRPSFEEVDQATSGGAKAAA